jgi:uncharacterized protein DUF1275
MLRSTPNFPLSFSARYRPNCWDLNYSFFLHLRIILLRIPLPSRPRPTKHFGSMTSSPTASANTMEATENADGELGLRPRKREKAAFPSSLGKNVNRDHGDIILLVCYFITGLLDSASISKWGSFVSMQTGTAPSPVSSFQSTCRLLHETF